MPKGNPMPTNNVRISLMAEILDTLARMDNPKGVPRSFQVATLAFTNPKFKKLFVEHYGEDLYQEVLRRYNRNRTEMSKDKEARESEKVQRQREKIELKKRELTIKEKELDIRQQNAELRSETLESENPTELQKAINTFNSTKSKPSKRGALATILKLAPKLGEKKQKECREGIPLLDLEISEDDLKLIEEPK